MPSQEFNELTSCCLCGAPIADDDTDRSFAASDDDVLCFECAVGRGGVYDALHERWTVPPSVSGLPDERRAHP
jgi:hypothetical protein